MPLWVLIIALVILIFGILMHQMGAEVAEDEGLFKILVVLFLVVYVGAAFLVSHFTPPMPADDNMAALRHFFTFNQS